MNLVYSLRNHKKEYVSMSGGVTKNWIEASKFLPEDIEKRTKYIGDEFELVEFEIIERKKDGIGVE